MAAPIKLSPCSTCCDETCTYFSDAFDSAIGPTWTEDVGFWEIDTGRLVGWDIGGVISNSTTRPGGGAYPLIVGVKFYGANGSKPRVIVNFTDEDNYTFVEIEIGSPGTIRVYDRSGGTDTLLITQADVEGVPASTWNAAQVCVVNGAVLVSIGFPGSLYLTYVNQAVSIDSALCGLGTGTDDGIQFDDFYLSRHKDDAAICPECQSVCTACGNSVPYQIGARGSGTGCSILDDADLALTHVTGCTWAITLTGGHVFSVYFLTGRWWANYQTPSPFLGNTWWMGAEETLPIDCQDIDETLPFESQISGSCASSGGTIHIFSL